MYELDNLLDNHRSLSLIVLVLPVLATTGAAAVSAGHTQSRTPQAKG